jgi:ribosome-dependent ATPase
MNGHNKQSPVVKLANVGLEYGKTKALEDISIEFPSGCMVGLIGPDGVGKSSLLALISGVRKIQTGRVVVLGGDMSSTRHRKAVCPKIAYMPQGLGKNLYHTLSVFENVDFFGRLFGQSSRERALRIKELLEGTGLARFSERPMGKLSGGMKQKLGLCCALIHDPELLILDEPTTGVDPLSRRQFWELIENIRSRKKSMSVIVATAYMEEAERFDWLVAMDGGKILARGTPSEIKSQTSSDTLEDSFIRLLPAEKQLGYKKLSIPPRISQDREIAIETSNLTKRFGDFTAVDKVSFSIQRGEIFGFVGSNGCGKTTTMKMLTGLLPATQGEAKVFGRQLVAKDIETRSLVGYMSQSFSLYTELTVLQNLQLHARLFHLSEDEIPARIEELSNRMGLEEVLYQQTEKLPLGIRQRLSLAVSVIHYPELLILDEPTSGVDPIARDRFWQLLVDLSRDKGVTIFISTHFMNEAERCDRVSLMHEAKVLATDTPENLINSQGSKNLVGAFISYLEQADENTFSRESNSFNAIQVIKEGRLKAYRFGTKKFFNLNSLWAFTRRESIELLRDPIRLFFALIGPIIMMIVLGYGISFDVENLPYAALDRDQTLESRKYLENFSGSRYFQKHLEIKSYDALENRLRNGELRLAIEIPPDFGKDLKRGAQPEIGIWLDGGFPFRAETARGYVLGLHDLYVSDIKENMQWETFEELPFNIETRFRYNQDMKSVFAMVPGLVAMMLALIPAILTAVGVVREKELGSITNLYSTPATRLDFLLGKQIPYIAIGVINFISLLILSILLFGVPVKGSLVALSIGALIFVMSTTGFGLLLSAFTKTQIAALFGAFLFTMINSMSFSGFLQPVSSLIGGGKYIAMTFPTTYFMNISRGTFTKALGFEDLYSNYIMICVFIVVFMILSFKFLKNQET